MTRPAGPSLHVAAADQVDVKAGRSSDSEIGTQVDTRSDYSIGDPSDNMVGTPVGDWAGAWISRITSTPQADMIGVTSVAQSFQMSASCSIRL